MKFDIFNRFSGNVQFTAEIECPADAPTSVKRGLAIKWAIINKANLEGANLYGANLTRVNLEGANLYGANLEDANLYGADLYGADLTDADLTDANLTRVNLEGANLYGADLTDADLTDTDLIVFQGFGSRFGTLYATKGSEQKIMIRTGCFYGDIDKFEERVKEEHEANKFAKDYELMIALIKQRFNS